MTPTLELTAAKRCSSTTVSILMWDRLLTFCLTRITSTNRQLYCLVSSQGSEIFWLSSISSFIIVCWSRTWNGIRKHSNTRSQCHPYTTSSSSTVASNLVIYAKHQRSTILNTTCGLRMIWILKVTRSGFSSRLSIKVINRLRLRSTFWTWRKRTLFTSKAWNP